jgi:hypothetical protein
MKLIIAGLGIAFMVIVGVSALEYQKTVEAPPFKTFKSGGNCVYVGKYVLVAVPAGPHGC